MLVLCGVLMLTLDICLQPLVPGPEAADIGCIPPGAEALDEAVGFRV